MRSPRDFFRPLALGAPAPLRDIPVRPSRMIHFFDPSNPKMVEKAPAIAKRVDILLGNLEDAIAIDNKEAAREGLIKIARNNDFGDTQLWTRVNSLDSPWFLDDITRIVTEVGDKVDVIMLPKVQGAWDIHFADQLLAQLEAKAGLKKPILLHCILETALGVANVEEIANASPRIQGMSLGPADLAASRRMKTTRIGGGHPATWCATIPTRATPRPSAPPTQQDLWHYTWGAWSTPASASAPCPSTDRLAPSTTRWPARTSSATPSSWAVSAPGHSTRARSRSPGRCSAPPPTRCLGQASTGGAARWQWRGHGGGQDAGRRVLEAVQGDGGSGAVDCRQGPGAKALYGF